MVIWYDEKDSRRRAFVVWVDGNNSFVCEEPPPPAPPAPDQPAGQLGHITSKLNEFHRVLDAVDGCH